MISSNRWRVKMESKDRGSYSYFLNWMGPVSRDWCEEHGYHWATGRIDVDGIPDEPYGIEYGVPLMHKEDWGKFARFLWDLNVDCLYTKEELFEMFESMNGQIRWKDLNESF